MKYAAFLRGINVGGNKKVPMAKLKNVLEDMGFAEVRTLLASGNVLFDAKKESLPTLEKKIAAELEKQFGFTIPVLLREVSDVENIIESGPFKGINVTKDTRLYVTFLLENHKSAMKIPYASPDKSFRIIRLDDDSVFSILDLSKSGTPEAMSILEKEFGKHITTRNWNTIMKVVGG